MLNEKKELVNEELNVDKKELTQEELEQVTGGGSHGVDPTAVLPKAPKGFLL